MTASTRHLAAVAEIATKLRTLRDEAAKIEATADSSDGLVRATVNSRGELLELELDDRIYRTSDSTALAESITRTIQAAANQVDNAIAAHSEKLFAEQPTS